MIKDFDNWNGYKKNLDGNKHETFCNEREIWWCSLGVNIGFEQDGTGSNYDRPFLVMKNFNKTVFWGVALTGKKKEGKYYFSVGEIAGTEASIILSQIRLLDTKRLVKKICMIPEGQFLDIKKALQGVLF